MNIISRIGVTGLLAFVALNVCAAPGSTPTASKPKFDVTGTWGCDGSQPDAWVRARTWCSC